MYLRLLYYANGARYKVNGEWVFRKWFAVPSKDLIRDLGKDRNTVRKVREELVKAGYIRYKTGVGAGRTEYMLCGLNATDAPQEAVKKAKAKPNETAAQGSFDTDDFFAAAVRKSFGEDP